MVKVDEHTIEETIIDPNGWVLDLGCINFTFAKKLKSYCKNVICVDPNPNIDPSNIPEDIIYERCAITHLDDAKNQNFYIYNDINGCSLLNPSRDWCILDQVVSVPTITIENLMKKYGIKKFELIKFDIEGAEYEILKNLDWGVSKQLSVEFHDFRFMNPYFPDNEKYYRELFEKHGNGYKILKHELTDHEGFPAGMGRNYWDSLFVEM